MLDIAPKEGLIFDMDRINRFSIDSMRAKLASLTYYVTVDLAVSEKQYADFTSICVVGIDPDSNDWFVVDGMHGRWKPDETINRIFQMVSRYRPYSVIIEKVAFQLAMKTFVQNEMIARGIFFNLEMVARTTQKISVIKALQPIVELGKLWIPNDFIQSFVDELIHEMEMTTAEDVKAKHDDLLDSLAMLTLIPLIASPAIGEHVSYDEEAFTSPYVF
jgi:predicted phage terminase large subunit-like protein